MFQFKSGSSQVDKHTVPLNANQERYFRLHTLVQKRNRGHTSPKDANSSKRDRRGITPSKNELQGDEPDFMLKENDLASKEPNDLVNIILKLRMLYQESKSTAEELRRENSDLRSRLTEAKLAFADRTLEDYHLVLES